MLESLLEALRESTLQAEVPVQTPGTRLEAARTRFGTARFTRRDCLGFFETIASATASRDLRLGADGERLERSGDKRPARYRFRKA